MFERGSYKKVHEVVEQVSNEVRMELGLKYGDCHSCGITGSSKRGRV